MVYLDGATLSSDAEAITEIARQLSVTGQEVEEGEVEMPGASTETQEVSEAEESESEVEESRRGGGGEGGGGSGGLSTSDLSLKKKMSGTFHQQLEFVKATLVEGHVSG